MKIIITKMKEKKQIRKISRRKNSRLDDNKGMDQCRESRGNKSLKLSRKKE